MASIEGSVEALRPAPVPAEVARRTAVLAAEADMRVVRAWARENNLPVPAAGRVPDRLVQQWREATSGEAND